MTQRHEPFGYFGHGKTEDFQVAFYTYCHTTFLYRYISVNKCGESAQVSINARPRDTEGVHTAAVPWLLLCAPGSALSVCQKWEFVIGLMLPAGLLCVCVCGAHPNLYVLPRIIQLPCTNAGSGARIYFISRALGLSRFTSICCRCGAIQTIKSVRLQNLELLLGFSKEPIADTSIVDLFASAAVCSPGCYSHP